MTDRGVETLEHHQNPFAQDVDEPLPPPATLVIFGATGDLAARKLLPAVYNLATAGMLPDHFRLIGVAVDSDIDSFRKHAREALEQFSRTDVDTDLWRVLSEQIEFVKGDFADADLYRRVAEAVANAGGDSGPAGGDSGSLTPSLDSAPQRIFYLATAPRFIGTIAASLAEVGLGAGSEPPTRLLVEKPFGHDLASASDLSRELATSFDDDQILHVDHYLGKETVQNLLFFRFTNGIFEPIWNRRYVDHVQITVAEDIGIGHRGGYYDRAGALRDVVQNHVLQLVSLVGMEPPASFAAKLIHDEKVKLLRTIERFRPEECAESVVRGQYRSGWIGGDAVPGYREEEDVPADSRTDTYVAMRLLIDNWRWAGVPFYVRTGKRLPVRLTEIAVVFRSVPHLPLPAAGAGSVTPNELVFQVQPNEGASLSLVAKVPGSAMTVRPVNMDFRYGESFLRESPEAYERLLYDALLGETTLFTSTAEIETTWKVVEPVIQAWKDSPDGPHPYEAGSAGPAAADELLERDGRRWRRL